MRLQAFKLERLPTPLVAPLPLVLAFASPGLLIWLLEVPDSRAVSTGDQGTLPVSVFERPEAKRSASVPKAANRTLPGPHDQSAS